MNILKLLKINDIKGKEHLVKIKSIVHIEQVDKEAYCQEPHYTVYLKRRYNSHFYISPEEYNRIKKELDSHPVGKIYG